MWVRIVIHWRGLSDVTGPVTVRRIAHATVAARRSARGRAPGVPRRGPHPTLEGSTPADGGSGFYYNLDTMNCINGEPCRPSRMPSSAACRRLSSS